MALFFVLVKSVGNGIATFNIIKNPAQNIETYPRLFCAHCQGKAQVK